MGVKDINYIIGDVELFYLDGVLVMDDVDGEVDVIVDIINVNLSVKGVYNIIYIVMDNVGNKEEVIVRVIVISNEVFVVGEIVIFKYIGIIIDKMIIGNNIVLVGLLELVFNVIINFIIVGEFVNIVGLNKDGFVRLYVDKIIGYGNILIVVILGE